MFGPVRMMVGSLMMISRSVSMKSITREMLDLCPKTSRRAMTFSWWSSETFYNR